MRKERVCAAIAHKDTDIVPYNIGLTSVELEAVCAYASIKPEDFFEYAGNHIEKAIYNSIGASYIRPGFYRDEYGVVWDRSGLDKDIGIISEYLINEDNYGEFVYPEPDINAIQAVTAKVMNNGRDTFKFGKIGATLFERLWSLRGFEDTFADFYLNEDMVDEVLKNITRVNLNIMDVALKTDIDGMYFGDDYGQQTGMLMSPDTWRKFIKPRLAEMCDKVKSAGKFVALHSCGNIEAIMGDLIDIGVDIYQTFQPEVYDIDKIKREYGADLTFWGAISTQTLLPYAKPAELVSTVKDLMRRLSINGGYIAAPTHDVPADVPPENICALIDFLRNQ